MTAVDPRATVTIDPRIRQRRIDVRRDAGRRRLRRLLVLVALLVALLAAVAAVLSPLFDVDRIDVRGATATPTEEILAAAGFTAGDQMVRLDVDAATAAVEALPWVDSAVVHRDFPARVEIVVTERTPVGIVRTKGGDEVLVDAEGRVLGPVALGHGDLARIETASPLPAPGQEVAPELVASLAVVEAVGEGIDGHTVLVRAERGGDVELLVDQRIEVALGPADRLDDKLRSVATVLDQVDLICVATIDVRVADRPVLTRDEPCQ